MQIKIATWFIVAGIGTVVYSTLAMTAFRDANSSALVFLWVAVCVGCSFLWRSLLASMLSRPLVSPAGGAPDPRFTMMIVGGTVGAIVFFSALVLMLVDYGNRASPHQQYDQIPSAQEIRDNAINEERAKQERARNGNPSVWDR